MAKIQGNIGAVQGVYSSTGDFLGLSLPSTPGDGVDVSVATLSKNENGDILHLEGLNKSDNVALNLADFQSLDEALDTALLLEFSDSTEATINLGVGTTSLSMSSKPKKRVEIIGTTYTTNYTSIASGTGSAGNYTITLNVASTTNIEVNDYIGIKTAPIPTGTDPYSIIGAFKVTAKTPSTITFISNHPVKPSGNITGSVKIYKSVVNLSLPNFTSFELYFKDVAIILNDVFISDASILVNDGGLFYSTSYSTLYVSRGGKFYADNSYYAGCFLRFDYGAHGHLDAAMLGNILTAFDPLIVSSEHSQVSARDAVISGSAVGVNCVSGSQLSLCGAKIAYCGLGIRTSIGSVVDAIYCDFIMVTTNTNPIVDTIGNGNSYINTQLDIFDLS